MSFVKQGWLDGSPSSATTDPVEVTGSTAYGLQMSVTGEPASGAVVLEGSIDGVNWFEVASVNVALAGTASRIVWADGTPVREIRLRMTNLGGGTSPTLSASVLAV